MDKPKGVQKEIEQLTLLLTATIHSGLETHQRRCALRRRSITLMIFPNTRVRRAHSFNSASVLVSGAVVHSASARGSSSCMIVSTSLLESSPRSSSSSVCPQPRNFAAVEKTPTRGSINCCCCVMPPSFCPTPILMLRGESNERPLRRAFRCHVSLRESDIQLPRFVRPIVSLARHAVARPTSRA